MSESNGAIEEEYADLGATTTEAMEIAETSMDIVRQFVPDETLADRVRQKSVHSMGDIEFQHLRVHRPGRDRQRRGCTHSGRRTCRPRVRRHRHGHHDGQSGRHEQGHDCERRKAIGHGSELAKETGMTRTAASVLELDKRGVYDGAIAVVGNAPTAAFALADCIENGTRPAAVVATPVGFVKASESRERIREVSDEYGVPAITNVGRRGGSGLAAALTNELIHVASDVRNGDLELDLAAETRVAQNEAGDADR